MVFAPESLHHQTSISVMSALKTLYQRSHISTHLSSLAIFSQSDRSSSAARPDAGLSHTQTTTHDRHTKVLKGQNQFLAGNENSGTAESLHTVVRNRFTVRLNQLSPKRHSSVCVVSSLTRRVNKGVRVQVLENDNFAECTVTFALRVEAL